MVNKRIKKLYKYRSAQNLWQIVDIVINNRVYCAKWSDLNDPLEGRYEVFFNERFPESGCLVEKIETKKNEFRIASLSADPSNFLLWSHYADGHKGVAIEVEIDSSHRDLFEVTYSPFSAVFSDKKQIGNGDLRYIFNSKSEEWAYEEEWRIITKNEFFVLPSPVKRVLLGPIFDPERRELLGKLLPPSVELIDMELDRVQCSMKMRG
jgi:Protein of unknown function (DUF2971)